MLYPPVRPISAKSGNHDVISWYLAIKVMIDDINQDSKMCYVAVIFLPEANFGLRVLSLPACVRVSVNHEFVWAITRHKFKLESPNLDKIMHNILLKVPILFWDWLGLTFQVKFYFIENFCLFASLLHLWNICETCRSSCSTSHMAPHTLSDYYMPTDRVTS